MAMGSIRQVIDKAQNREGVGNGLRMVARGCQGSPEVPVDLQRGLQTVPGPGGAARGQFRAKLTIRAASTVGGALIGAPWFGVGGMAQPLNIR